MPADRTEDGVVTQREAIAQVQAAWQTVLREFYASLTEAGFHDSTVRRYYREVSDLDDAIVALTTTTIDPSRERAGEMQRIDRDQYPEIIQAARWMDEDNGTAHFQPGVGYIVDDPDGLTVPTRWVPHLDKIEAALAGLDHHQPHPLDIDTIECLAREGKAPSLHDSAAYCFVAGEETPVTAMANSSEALWVANRFFNERFEGWEFDPAVGFVSPEPVEDRPDSGEALAYEREYFERGFVAAAAWLMTKREGDVLNDATIDHAWDNRDAGMDAIDVLPVRAPQPTDGSVERLVTAASAIISRMSSSYKAKNGRDVGIQGDDGEKCWIVHSDDINELQFALLPFAALSGSDRS